MSVQVPPALLPWAGRRVLLTGCTGFKGAWLARWLHHLRAEVHGLALDPPTTPSLWDLAGLGEHCRWHHADLRDADAVRAVVEHVQPDAVLHLGAVSLVQDGYEDPLVTLTTNVMGTAHVLEAVRHAGRPCGVLVITTDKVYAERDDGLAHREDDNLGAADPYATSKACAELIVASWRHSFLPPEHVEAHGIAIATARAGNVVGPGDFAPSRLVPSVLHDLIEGRAPCLRDPSGVRPWQHVLEPLSGYLVLGARLLPGATERARWCDAFNFGPWPDAARTVGEVVDVLQQTVGHTGPRLAAPQPHREANTLRLAVDKAVSRLSWRPALPFTETLVATAVGHQALIAAEHAAAARQILDHEIAAYTDAARRAGIAWASKDDHVADPLPRVRERSAAPGAGPRPYAAGQPGAAA